MSENSTTTAPESARGLDFSQDLAKKGWYHSFEFADGTVIDGYMPLKIQKERYARYPISEDLRGKRNVKVSGGQKSSSSPPLTSACGST